MIGPPSNARQYFIIPNLYENHIQNSIYEIDPIINCSVGGKGVFLFLLRTTLILVLCVFFFVFVFFCSCFCMHFRMGWSFFSSFLFFKFVFFWSTTLFPGVVVPLFLFLIVFQEYFFTKKFFFQPLSSLFCFCFRIILWEFPQKKAPLLFLKKKETRGRFFFLGVFTHLVAHFFFFFFFFQFILILPNHTLFPIKKNLTI